MIRVNLRNSTGEPIDFFEVGHEDEISMVLAAKIACGTWLLQVGDTITVEEAR